MRIACLSTREGERHKYKLLKAFVAIGRCRGLKTGSIPVIPTIMMKLGDKKREFEERRIDLCAELLSTDMSAMSVQRFEYIYRQIHILTLKILSFKGGLNNGKDKE